MKINAKVRKQASKIVHNILKPTYFRDIPLEELMAGLKEVGIVIIQEDNTEWAGFLLGSDERVLFTLGDMNTSVSEAYGEVYEEIENAGLLISWYKQEKKTGKQIEVIGYLS